MKRVTSVGRSEALRYVVRLLAPVAVLLAGFLALLWWAQPIAAFLGRREPWDAVDFATLYSAADAVLRGDGHLLYSPDALLNVQDAAVGRADGEPLAYLNPPFFALLLAPLALLPFDTAFQVWLLLNAALLALTAWLLHQIVAPLPPRLRLALVVVCLSLYPLTFALRLGQFSVLLLLSWAAAYLFLKRGADCKAGVALAGLLIKPELLIPVSIYLLWTKRTGVFETLLPLTLTAVAVSFLVTGIEAGLGYPEFILSNANDAGRGTRLDLMFGWNGLLGGFLGNEDPLRTTLLSLPFVTLTALAVIKGCSGRAGELARDWLVVTLGTVLVDPNFFIQDTLILASAALGFAAAAQGLQRPVALGAIALGWVILAFGLYPGGALGLNVFSLYVATILALLVLRRRAATVEMEGAAGLFQRAA